MGLSNRVVELIVFHNGGLAPFTPMSTFYRKKYQKLTPAIMTCERQASTYLLIRKLLALESLIQSPGVPLLRYSVRFFNSALWASDTKNLFTLAPQRSTEIFLMGPERKITPLTPPLSFRLVRNLSSEGLPRSPTSEDKLCGSDSLYSVFLLSALSWALHMNKLTLAWRLTVTLAIMTNKSPCPLVRKGVKGDLGGAGD
jgi:hypothetical protein